MVKYNSSEGRADEMLRGPELVNLEKNGESRRHWTEEAVGPAVPFRTALEDGLPGVAKFSSPNRKAPASGRGCLGDGAVGVGGAAWGWSCWGALEVAPSLLLGISFHIPNLTLRPMYL